MFLILLAVVLFAALSYAVTSSMRGGGKNASTEALQSQVATLQNVDLQVRTALQRMKLSGGYELWQIDYSKSGFSNATANATCATTACKLHDPTGGAIAGYTIPINHIEDAATCSAAPGHSGRYSFRNQTVKGVGVETERDLVLRHYGVSRELCLAINDANGIANATSTTPPAEQFLSVNLQDYTGTLSSEVTLTDTQARLGDQASGISGKQMFCLRETGSSSGCFTYYFVLVER